MNPNLLSTCNDLLSRILKDCFLYIENYIIKHKTENFFYLLKEHFDKVISMIRRSLRNQIREPPYKFSFILNSLR